MGYGGRHNKHGVPSFQCALLAIHKECEGAFSHEESLILRGVQVVGGRAGLAWHRAYRLRIAQHLRDIRDDVSLTRVRTG